MLNVKHLVSILFLIVLCAGCAAPPKQVIYDNDYQHNIYPYSTTIQCTNFPYTNTNRFDTHWPYGKNVSWYHGDC